MALCPPPPRVVRPAPGMALCPPRPGWFGPRRGWRSSSPAPGSSARAGDGALPPPPRVVRPAPGMAVAHSTPFLRSTAGSGPFPKVRRAGGLATKNCATPLSASCEFFLGQLPLSRLHLLPPLPRFSLLGCVFRRLDAAPAAAGFSFPGSLSRRPRRSRRPRLLLPRLPLPSPRRRPRRSRLLPSPASSSPPPIFRPLNPPGWGPALSPRGARPAEKTPAKNPAPPSGPARAPV